VRVHLILHARTISSTTSPMTAVIWLNTSSDGSRMGIGKRKSCGFTMILILFYRDLHRIAVGRLYLNELTDDALLDKQHDLLPVDIANDLIVHLQLRNRKT